MIKKCFATMFGIALAGTVVPAVTQTLEGQDPATGAGIQGEFSEAFWDRPFDPEDLRSAKVSIALAMLIPDLRSYKVSSEPYLLQREVRLHRASTRKIALNDVTRAAGISLSKSGRSITVASPQPVKIVAPTTELPALATNSADPAPAPIEDAPVLQPIDVSRPIVNTVPQALPTYRATLGDGNIRLALVRWASLAGWTFAPEHWSSPVDISLSAEADFGSDFKAAARGLLAATELSGSPLQPCFYSNQVLRVISMVERCDRTRTN